MCLDKDSFDEAVARRQLGVWLRMDFAEQCGEIHYSGITPRIVCEEYLGDADGNFPRDYKMHCFHGHVRFTMVCSGRGLDGRARQYDYYDRAWEKKLPYSKSGIHLEREIAEPERYAAMVDAAEALSGPFPYVRMDFFCVGGRAVLGEMTFTPAACTDSGYTDEVQKLGALITLPAPFPG